LYVVGYCICINISCSENWIKTSVNTLFFFLSFLWRCGPTRAIASSFLRFLDHTQRRTTVGRTGRVISSSQRPLADNIQHSQHTNFHAPSGIRTHDLSRRAASDLRLRPRGHWDRRILITILYLLSLSPQNELLLTVTVIISTSSGCLSCVMHVIYPIELIYNFSVTGIYMCVCVCVCVCVTFHHVG